jgi:hypothetical protein
MVQMVGFDVGDHGEVGCVGQEGAVTLVGLGHEDVAAAVVGAGTGDGEVSPDEERRVGATVLQRNGEHGRGGSLAGGPGDAGDPVTGHQGR